MTTPRHWIPPYALLAGQLFHGMSWLVLALSAWPDAMGLTWPGLAWVHLVALGWLSMSALAVLLHVVPGFMDVEWVGEGVVRWSLLPFGLGVAGLVAGFLMERAAWLAWSATLIVAALVTYAVPALLTVFRIRPEVGQRAPFRVAFSYVLLMFLAAGLLGLTMAGGLAGWQVPGWWPRLLPIHALMAGGGWLTLLIWGVSTRTAFRVTETPRRKLPFHGRASAMLSLGLIPLVVGLWPGVPVWLFGLGLLPVSLAVLLYVVDLLPVLWRASTPHRPPVAFLRMTLVYLLGVLGLGWGLALGQSSWQLAFGFLALVGWMGQSVNGYALHIGIRLLSTVRRGEADETEPIDLLSRPLSWLSFGAFQLAVLLGTVALLMGSGGLLNLAGWSGLAAWLLWIANVRKAWRRAAILPTESP